MRAQGSKDGWLPLESSVAPVEAKRAWQILSRFEGRRLFELTLQTAVRPLRTRAGWLAFRTTLRPPAGGSGAPICLASGIVSGGGRGVSPWAEFGFYLAAEGFPDSVLEVSRFLLEKAFVELMGEAIAPGGHIMIDYESGGQEETFIALSLRIPPPATYLGELAFRAGFCGAFKDWYFSEGGHEGPRKLQANKPPTEEARLSALREHRRDLEAFLARALPAEARQREVALRARERAYGILDTVAIG